MEWPSKNVAKGGIFQPVRVKYSDETKNFLQTLINESKMTTFQRNRLNYSLRTGEPLPSLNTFDDQGYNRSTSTLNGSRRTITERHRPGSSRRRTLETIIQSGAYEMDYKPSSQYKKTTDREELKRQLQEKMSRDRQIKMLVENKVKPKPAPKKEGPCTRYEQLKQEIQEREEWLREMERLGAADPHRNIIEQQIQQKLREIERLKAS